MKKYIYLIITLAIGMLFISGCSSNLSEEIISYYILDYIPHLDNPELKQRTPFPYSVEITETQLPRSYQRNQIVEKSSINTIKYMDKHLWADKLYNSIPQLLLQKTHRYNFFENPKRDFFTNIPDYYIDTFVGNIEKVEMGGNAGAHVKMDFYLRNSKQKVVIVHRFNREIQIADNSMPSVVQTFSQIISEEYDKFLAKVVLFYEQGIEVTSQIPELGVNLVEYDDIYDEADDNSVQNGELIVPNLSQSDKAPTVLVMDVDTNYSTEIEMGEVKNLHVGNYTLYLGQGQDFDITKSIEIKSKYRTIVTPSWSSLTINIIDTGKSRVRMPYDIYKGVNNEPIGFDFSAADEAGEENRVWILNPGRYFITIDGASFSSYIDFTTVDLVANQHYNLTIVVDPDGINGKLLGAGIHPQEADRSLDSYYTSQNAFHLNFNVNANNDTRKSSFDETITLSSQFDKKMYYQRGNFDYEGRIDWELGLGKESNQSLKISVDNFRFNNTVIYNVWHQFGIYGRVDASSHFFPRYNYFTSNQNFKIYDNNEVLIDSLFNKDDIKVQNPIFPLTIKEDMGLNYRINNGKYGNINFRAGLGWLQTINDDVLVATADEAGFKTYKTIPNTSTQGLATSIVSTVNIPQIRLTWSSTADLLIPLESDPSPTFEFINIFNIKLINNVSWDFRFDVNYDENVKDYFVYRTSSFIRLSYFF